MAVRERLALPGLTTMWASPVASAPRSSRGKRASWNSANPNFTAWSSTSRRFLIA
jgi:hypothetical protein